VRISLSLTQAPFCYADEIGIVRRYSEPLAKAGITIIYVSTFNTDLILVQEHLAEQAVTALKAHQTNGIKRSTSKSQLQASTEIAMGSSPPASFKFVSSETDSAASDGNLAVLSQLPYELILACFKRSSISALTHTLLKLLLFPAKYDLDYRPNWLCLPLYMLMCCALPFSDDRFFAFTSYGGEVTVIMEKQELDQFGLESVQRITTNNQSWSVIHVQSGPSGVSTYIELVLTHVLCSMADGFWVFELFCKSSRNWCSHKSIFYSCKEDGQHLLCVNL
jgi:hypothetical protein